MSQYCSVNNEWEGVCVNTNFYIDPVLLYPGDPCVENDFKAYCAYGPQK
jgi:hypothetical protein